MSENVEKVMDLDPGMENDPREDVKEIENEEVENRLTFDLVNGICMSTHYDVVNWKEVYEQIPELEKNILSLKNMYFEMTCTPVADRDKMVEDNMPRVLEAHENFGLHDDQYELRPDITKYEKLQMMAINVFIVMSEITHYAQIDNLLKIIEDKNAQIEKLEEMISTIMASVGGLTDEMVEEFRTSLDEIEKETEEIDETVGEDTNKEKNNE